MALQRLQDGRSASDAVSFYPPTSSFRACRHMAVVCRRSLVAIYREKQSASTFNTQRGMMVPGRNNIVACDSSGRVVDFEIQEGKGDIRNYLISL